MRFTYASGSRPLEGFTLKRGVGRGGFGEVYFAVSDGGKEVALKLLRDNSEIELRGVAQCLNLKHPNLVNLYDLRTDARGEHWVVMENVAGESLSALLGRYPKGLPIELAREWFLGLARAVTYLHDHGIVHRDLKPGNIFLENGVVKVGDYGLSKCISTSQRTAQTQSIGTVHYMAPEISSGNYNKSIDVYAAGVILYDLSPLPQPFGPILGRALHKNPAQRYLSVSEFAQAVESTAKPRPSTEPVTPSRDNPRPAPLSTKEPGAPAAGPPSSAALLGELFGSMVLAVVFAALATAFWAAVVQSQSAEDLGAVFFLTVAASWAILVPSKFWTRPLEESWRGTYRSPSMGRGEPRSTTSSWG